LITPAYTFTARVLHWITAFLILSIIPLGVVIANEWGGSAQDLYDLHRSIGAVIIPLVILRIIYRWVHPPLALPDHVPSMQKLAGRAYRRGALSSFRPQGSHPHAHDHRLNGCSQVIRWISAPDRVDLWPPSALDKARVPSEWAGTTNDRTTCTRRAWS
jgi:hypothetical protein